MAETLGAEQDALKGKRSAHQFAPETERPGQSEFSALGTVSMLSGSRLDGRGTGSVRSDSIQRMQATYGNRAVQRYLSTTAPSRSVQRQTSVPVQRLLGLEDAWDWAKGAASSVGDVAKDAADVVGDAASGAWDAAKDTAKSVGNAASDAWDWTKGAADKVGNTVSDAYDWTKDKASAGANWVGDKVSDAWDWTKGAASGAWDWGKKEAGAAWDWTKKTAGDAYDWTKEKAGAAYDWAAGKVEGAVDWAKDLFKEKPKTFDDLTKGGIDTADAPKNIKLPEVMNKGMGEAWSKSFPGGQSQEQGGILVQNEDGSYEWKAGTAKTRAEGGSGAFSPNRGDVGKGQTLVGTGHTHPYDATEGGMTNVPFSGTDLANMIYNPEKLKMVQSGEGQFVSARTSEFDEKIKDLDAKGKKEMYDNMKKEFDAIMYNPKDKRPFEERNRDAAIQVSKKYGLLFYEGKGGDLALQ